MTSAEPLSPAALSALLHFYADCGVDWLLEETPVDRIAEFAEQRAARAAQRRDRPATPQAAPVGPAAGGPAERASAGAAPRGAAPAAPVAVPDADAVAAARLAAESAGTLEALRQALEGFGGCNLKNGARSTVFATGSAASGIMVLGPMPSADDDRDGLPFCGRQGQLLDRMLSAIGLARDTVLLSTVVPWRTPGNRAPSPAEMEICRPFIERQIQLAAPRRLLLLGNFTARFFLGEDGTIFSLRGTWRDIALGPLTVRALASLHPQDLLTAPANKALAWQDLLTFRHGLTG
ncbi:uracil-DNA glycosylase [Rhizobium straminoryzae]|uniref:Type-4 uracil-DNA glycosylase n=1 Tax=Rhizobium straminoryzae TaxID=1387186 RepID=A0A549T466_9HYPH|nr:uracil-DNA glycosylase [Rhizobium straminoryzae]TRL36705.1 uracil-DNA glycosylase [Rhizobium straminoryzae]